MGTYYVATQAIQSMSEYEAILCHFAANIYLECSSHELCQGFESRLKFIIIYPYQPLDIMLKFHNQSSSGYHAVSFSYVSGRYSSLTVFRNS